MRLVDSDQARTVASFGSRRRTNDRLHRLVEAGHLRRCFIGTIASGRKAIYFLSKKGAAMVCQSAPSFVYGHDRLVSGDSFISHQLHINSLYLAFRYGVLPPGTSFSRWYRFVEPLSHSIRLIPDGYCDLETPSGMRSMFVEVDLGNESLRIWKEKIERYLLLATSGSFEQLFGQKQFRVLVVAPTMRRLLSIRKAVAAATSKVFWFGSLPDINAAGLFAPVWLRPTGEDRQPLL